MHHSCLRKASFARGRLVLQQVVFESLATHDLSAAAATETLGCRPTRFQFRHSFSSISTQSLIIL